VGKYKSDYENLSKFASGGDAKQNYLRVYLVQLIPENLILAVSCEKVVMC
jgi:hypothetical protein